mgnify:CR=1 FL=1
MSTLELKELSHPSGEVIKIAAGKTLDLKSQGTTTLPTGSVLQVVQHHTNSKLTVNSTTTKVIETSLTTKMANSKILCTISVSFGNFDGYTDDDIALALGYKVGSSGSSSTNYSAVYWVEERSYSKLFTISAAEASLVYVSLWASVGGGTYNIGGANNSSESNAGAETTITLMEVSP